MEPIFYDELATAFVRGRLGKPDATVADGLAAGLRLYKFKRGELPRVRRVLGILRGLAPSDLLDIGSGRGAFLWPLLDAFPQLPVTTVEIHPQRLLDLRAVVAGGITRLRVAEDDVSALSFADDAFDVSTVLEVLEHLETPERAVSELMRVTRRFIVASVPSKPDDNPQHLRLFTPEMLSDLFMQAGAVSVQIEHVLNHRIVVVKVSP